MIFKQYGDCQKPSIMFLHGGGVASWMWGKQIEALERDFHIITAELDGHGEAYQTTFTTIAKCAEQCIAYIEEHLQGKIFALCGFSIGGQIVVEILSRANHIAEKAIIESALVQPLSALYQRMNRIAVMSYGLIRYRWFAKMQAQQMYIEDALFEHYYRDSMRISKASFANMIEENSQYRLPETFKHTSAKVLVLCGGKELAAMQESAEQIAAAVPGSYLQKVAECGHGVCMKRPNVYTELARRMFHVHHHDHSHDDHNHHGHLHEHNGNPCDDHQHH